MKKQLLLAFASVFMVCQSQAQTDKLWTSSSGNENVKLSRNVETPGFPSEFKLFKLDYSALKQALSSAQDRALSNAQGVVISMPNAEGKIEHFKMYEASNFDSALQAQFPNIRAYVGIGVEDSYAQIRISISPEGISTMTFRADRPTEFIEKYSEDGKIYASYYSNRTKGQLPFTCSTSEQNLVDDLSGKAQTAQRSSSGQYLIFRLAMSCTGEYAAFHGGTQAGALAAINATMTRVNGVFEKDFAIHMNLVNNLTILYTNAATDPYGATDANYNAEVQSTLTAQVGEANYDVGHLVSAIGNNGNAGCIGCVCTNGSKGSGFTTSTGPVGDNFDIDFVAHELGHQFGANHSFSFSTENNSVNYEVGSGSTIMGYAGITSYDIQPHSDDHFHAGNIAQVQANMVGKACPTVVAITHGAPVVNAGSDWTIPRSTPFILTGSATDTGGGALTYCWEQYDDAAAAQLQASSPASVTKALGPNWMSYSPTSSPSRYMPRMATVLAGQQITQGAEIAIEALSSVARTLNFRLTVRDNVPLGGQTNFDNMVVTVDATRGPLTVTSQNVDNQSWLQNSTQTITWAVNSTNTSTGGTNVDILLSTDGGLTYPTVLVANTPNDGTQNITVPNIAAMNCRVMVKASGNIFFNVNPKPIAIGYTVATSCNTYSNNTALPVPDGVGANAPGAVVSKTIAVPGPTSTISDVNVTLGFTHSYIEDLVIAMNHPDATQVALWNRNCDNAPTTLTYTFSDGNPLVPATGCSASTGTFGAPGSLASLNGKPNNGTWTLLAADYYNGDIGTINTWSIEICSQTFTLANAEFEFEDFALFPNPNNGDFTVKFNSASTNDIKINVHDIRGRQVYEKSFSNTGAFNQNINLDKVQSGIYLVSIIDGAKKTVKRIIVE